MSSIPTAGLSRARSLRKPTGTASSSSVASKDNSIVSGTAAATATAAAEPRNVSPSRLPIKPPNSSRTTSSSVAGNRGLPTRSNSVSGNTSRPLGRAPSVRKNTVTGISGKDGVGNSASSNQAGSTLSMPPPPAPSTRRQLAQPTSTATESGTRTAASRPGTSSGISETANTSSTGPPSSGTRGHARNKSSVTALSGRTVLRPPTASTTVSKPPITTTHRRNISTVDASSSRPPQARSRPPSAGSNRPPSATSTAPSTTTTTTRAPTHRRGISANITSHPHLPPPTASTAAPAPALRPRPAFNTNQTHYSPAKSLAPKPAMSTYLAPASPSKRPVNIAISAETARLQAQLLQLHLLHRSAAPTAEAWRRSARENLEARFVALKAKEESVRSEEKRCAEVVNAAALRVWGGDGRGSGLEEKIVALEGVVSGVWALTEPAGRYCRVVRTFEKWTTWVRNAEAARSGGLPSSPDEEVFIPALEGAWREECAALVRKLDGWRRDLRALELGWEGAGEGELGETGIGRMLEGFRSMVHDMLAELNMMEEIEREAIQKENEWVRETVREEGQEHEGAARAGAIWRVL